MGNISAFANTNGGTILLGVSESADGTLIPQGVGDTEAILKDFWNTVSNRNKVSLNILSPSDVTIHTVDGKDIIAINVPQANRTDRPVYLKGDHAETFIRRGDGDYRCTEKELYGMIRDASEPNDRTVLERNGLDSLSMETVSRYRNLFSAKRPDHVWAGLSVPEFLYRIGAVGKGNDGQFHPTKAGLLMFGFHHEIVQIFSQYFLDYQEKLDASMRWTDRIISSSGDWSGNIYDFFFRISSRLEESLRRPFQLDGIYRVDDTAMHKAVREALANALIHADYDGERGTVIIRGTECISFTNPGRFRISPEVAKQGGISDTRNPAISTMFSLIDIGERAGTGLEAIYRTYRESGLSEPVIEEDMTPARVRLTLPLTKLPSGMFIKEREAEYVPLRSHRHSIPYISGRSREHMILDYLDSAVSASSSQIADMLGLRSSRTKEILSEMVAKGLITAEGRGPGRRYRIR